MGNAVDHKFQINLRGIIDLLSGHLYSTPEVFVRELLQNGVDAVHAREMIEPGFLGEITLELHGGRGGKPPTLVFTDNGVGLTEDEVHRFLATIGQSSKNEAFWHRPTDFIGQFGIGLLSCFVVSDEIVVVTRSARGGEPAVEWRGKPDGTYTVKTLAGDFSPGTQVFLTARKGAEDYFEPDRLAERVHHYGSLLPYPIRLSAGGPARLINAEGPPWRGHFASDEERRTALLEYGRKTLGEEFFDAIPLRSGVGEVEGVAFVLPYSPSLATRRTHRVYLKHMLLSESVEGLVPDWAFFVKCVVNANDLRPTASRESFVEDDKLAATRDALGRLLRDYLCGLARHDPRRLQQLVALHHLSIKALAARDDDFFRLFIDWLPFETSTGRMMLGEYRARHRVLRYTTHLDRFRQIARVAAAQGLCVINAGYVHDDELMARFPEVFPGAEVEEIDPAGLAQSFEDLDLAEREEVFALVKAADLVLQRFMCAADVKKFRPAELPALYATDADADLVRSAEQSRQISDELWSSVLDNLTSRGAVGYAQLCFNFNNPLVRKLARLRDRRLLPRCIQMLYVQALLLGHHPLNDREMALLNEGLLGLIEWGVDAQEGRGR
jgi:molecular chaperone HtpG